MQVITVQVAQGYHLLDRLNAFGGHFDAQVPAEVDDGLEDAGGLWRGVERMNEGAVDFQFREWKLPQVAQAGLASAEIVQGDGAAHVTKRVQL